MAQALVEQFVELSGRRLTALLTDRSAAKGDEPRSESIVSRSRISVSLRASRRCHKSRYTLCQHRQMPENVNECVLRAKANFRCYGGHRRIAAEC